MICSSTHNKNLCTKFFRLKIWTSCIKIKISQNPHPNTLKRTHFKLRKNKTKHVKYLYQTNIFLIICSFLIFLPLRNSLLSNINIL